MPSRSFHWATDKTPAWFSEEYAYRMNPDTHEIEVPTMKGNAVVKPGDLITEVEGGFFMVGEQTAKPNREQRRKNLKAKEERLVVRTITVAFENGQTVNLDPSKIMIVDKDTKANLFEYVMEKKQ